MGNYSSLNGIEAEQNACYNANQLSNEQNDANTGSNEFHAAFQTENSFQQEPMLSMTRRNTGFGKIFSVKIKLYSNHTVDAEKISTEWFFYLVKF